MKGVPIAPDSAPDAASARQPSVNNPAAVNQKGDWISYGSILLVLAWWIYDLQFQWRLMPEYQFGWLVLLLVGFLIFDRWPNRPVPDAPPSVLWPSIFAVMATPCVIFAELYRIGVARTAASSFVLSIGCALFVCTILASAQGFRTLRYFLFPVLFLFLAVPLPKLLWNPIVFELQWIITALTVETLNLFGVAAVRHGHVIQLPNCVVGVDEACSGVRSLQSSIMAALFLGDVTLKRTRSRIFLIAAGVVLALLGNSFRSVYLSMIAHHRGVETLRQIHDAAGWSILAFTAVGLIAIVWLMLRFEKLAFQESDRPKDPRLSSSSF